MSLESENSDQGKTPTIVGDDKGEAAGVQALREKVETLEQSVRKRTAELESAKTTAEQANDAKSSFLAMISHEIRTPLNAILGMATALQESEMESTHADMVGVIRSSADSLLDLLNDLLDLSKIEARKMEVEAIRFDLPRLLRETHKLFGVKAGEKGLKFDLELGQGVRGHVIGDPTRIKQVFSNLLSNAVKFTEAGEISANAFIKDGFLTLVVADTGVGVPEEGQASLFTAFDQADVTVARTHGGTGLGLEISRRLCLLMQGDLTYQRNRTRGSVFTATMQVEHASKDDARASGGYPDAEQLLTSRQWRVLAAEDNKTNRKVLELLLKRFGFELRIVDDGAQLVKAFQEEPADIILMDVNMPVLNGIEAAARIRVFERAKRMSPVPIVALTANAMTHQVADYLRRGFDAHVPKPVRRDELAGCMARLLRSQAE